jgi:trk system potassium uptake protein TrkA
MAKRRTYAVIGLGRFGSAVARTLAEMGEEVIGIDSSEERVRELADVLSQAVQLEASDEKALREAGVQDVDCAVISIGENIEASLLVVMQVLGLGVPTVIAKAVTDLHGKILTKLGVSRVVYPEREMAARLAHGLVVPNALEYIELSKEYAIIDIDAPPQFAGHTLKELELRPRFGLTLIAIKRPGAGSMGPITIVAPPADQRIEAGDVLSLLGATERLEQVAKLMAP